MSTGYIVALCIIGGVSALEFVAIMILTHIVAELCNAVASILEGKYKGWI